MGSIQATKQTLPWVETPLIESRALSAAAGCRIFLKLENLQPSGSFKSRGIGNYIIHRLTDLPADAETPSHFYCVSGGNAGLACIVAAVSLGHKASIIVPMSCAKSTINRLYNAGASNVIQYGKSLQAADDYLRSHVLKENPTGIYVPPFDHPDIWSGNATVMEELGWHFGADAPDAVICSVGGGGLLCGVVDGMERLNWNETEVVAVETAGADSLAGSLRAGKNTTLEHVTSAATSLACVRVADKAYDYATRKDNRIRSVVLDDRDAAMACLRLTDDERFMVELACGVNAAVCYKGILGEVLKRNLTEQSKVVLILCGGSNVNLEIMASWRELYGL
ncbi:pyridoxal-phosphate dependent enzyme [Phlyctema vagabunda]|uniref:L-serine ammonia-lyase n=1 Tax=Phlyctema vagabunda TaxID=108571 RepID=A0ABR4PXQ2_9HELO